MGLWVKSDYVDSATLQNVYLAIVYSMGHPKRAQKQGKGPFLTIPQSPAYPTPFVKSYGWAYEPVSIYDGPNPGEEGLVFGDHILAFNGLTRSIPIVGPVFIDLAGYVALPDDWTKRDPIKPPWV